MPNIELTDQQAQDLLILLNRVQLTGAEAMGFLVILQAIERAFQGMLASQDGSHSPHEPETVSAPEPITGT